MWPAKKVTKISPDKPDILSDDKSLYSSLDRLGTNILIADIDLTLIYMNQKSKKTLSAISHVIQSEFHLSVDELVGQSIDRFHKGAAKERVRAIMRNSANFPHRATISLAGIKLDLNINTIETHGQIAGYVVNWEDVTEKERFEDEALGGRCCLQQCRHVATCRRRPQVGNRKRTQFFERVAVSREGAVVRLQNPTVLAHHQHDVVGILGH